MAAPLPAGDPGDPAYELQELRQRTTIIVCWKARGGGVVSSKSVQLRDPATGKLSDTSDAELAVILSLWRRRELAVLWPINSTLSTGELANVIDRDSVERLPMAPCSSKIDETAWHLSHAAHAERRVTTSPRSNTHARVG